jgi:hypothetical protein
MHKKSLFAVALSAAALTGLSAGPAFAGEIKGPGSPTGIPIGSGESFTAAVDNANSICAFSGLNHLHAGFPGELEIRTQSYGQLVRAGLKSDFPSPGDPVDGCRGGSNFHNPPSP